MNQRWYQHAILCKCCWWQYKSTLFGTLAKRHKTKSWNIALFSWQSL